MTVKSLLLKGGIGNWIYKIYNRKYNKITHKKAG